MKTMSMSMKRIAPLTILLLAAAISVAVIATARAAEQTPAEWDGLNRISVKGLQNVYARPGATLAPYDKVMLDPVQVSFSKSWRPNEDEPDPALQVTQADRERIRTDVAALVRREFTRDIGRKGGYPVVDAPGPDVLRITAEIIDLYITAPDVMSAGRVTKYVRSAGSMTLVVELRDSQTGQLIARAVDRKVDPDTGWLSVANSVTNAAAAERAVSAWTRVLRRQLDAAREAVGSAPPA